VSVSDNGVGLPPQPRSIKSQSILHTPSQHGDRLVAFDLISRPRPLGVRTARTMWATDNPSRGEHLIRRAATSMPTTMARRKPSLQADPHRYCRVIARTTDDSR